MASSNKQNLSEVEQFNTTQSSLDSKPVLVVGGSLVGLSAAMFLSWHNVPVILVERHTGSSEHPRAIGYPARTMELFRSLGIDSQIPQTPANFKVRRQQVESLAGKWFNETEWTPEKGKRANTGINYSPCNGAAIAQDRLEPILRSKAAELGADIRLGTELVGFSQDNNGINASLKERTGKEYTLKCSYMIASDGSNSKVREALNITRKGRGHIKIVRSVLFHAHLDEYLKTGIIQFEIEQPGLKAFLTTYNDGRWVLMFSDDIERDEHELEMAIFKAIGRTDIPVKIITVGRWDLSALVSNSFTSGRVFLAGDSAHTLPPTRGGFGANTGIQDVHNLAWKIAAVLSGKSTPNLLDTYESERYPVAWLRHQQIFARPDYAADAPDDTKHLAIIDDVALELGQIYKSKAIIGASIDLPEAMRPDQWLGQPGTRAPHAWLTQKDVKISSLDLFQKGWVLLSKDAMWQDSAIKAKQILGLNLECKVIGQDCFPLEPEKFLEAFGIGYTGASLVRPDGFIAWRIAKLPSNPEAILVDVLKKLAFIS